MLQMTFDAQTNAGKRVMSNVVSVVTCDTLYTKDSVLGSGQKTLYFMTLCKFPPFARHIVMSEHPTNSLWNCQLVLNKS